MKYQRVTIYVSSSQGLAPTYYDAAARLGHILAEANMQIVYGGGRIC